MNNEIDRSDLSNLGFTRRPKKQPFSIAKWSGISVVLIVVIFVTVSLQQGWMTVQFHFGGQPTSPTQNEASIIGDTQQRVERILPPSQNETIALLREEIELAFMDQIEEWFEGGDNLDEKVERYEALMEELGRAYYQHYVVQGHGTLEDAYKAMEEYVLNFEVEGVTLSQDSVEYYQQYIVEE